MFARAAVYSEYWCNGTTGTYTASDAFGANLGRLGAALPVNASTSPSLFATAAVGAAPDRVFGLALCRGDIMDAGTCSGCVSAAFQRLRGLCAGDRGATFYHDLCMVRYSGDDFLARPDDNSPVVNGMEVNASTFAGWDCRNATSRSFFLSLVGTLFGEMAMYGAYNSTSRHSASAVMLANPTLPTVYGMAQCTPDLSPAQCWRCFQGLQDQNHKWYDGRKGGRILGVRCSFRYESYQFYEGSPDVRIGVTASGKETLSALNNGNRTRKVQIIVLCATIAGLCCMIVAVGCFLLTRRVRKGRSNARTCPTAAALKLWKIGEGNSEFTTYDFSLLAAATNNFSEEKKLGSGGFGPVYKGMLPDGAEVAVKRLAAQSGQGLEEFKNEIQLIAMLQHTNLVKLLGCCVQEEEKVLVYEFMPNRSLDFFIFDEERGPLLDWKKRRHILDGIAQGLLYLHKHSRVRVIHRDLKASNILLDKDHNPKISDFGMARIFCSNMTHDNTNRVVGTHGYMAPEYAFRGVFSAKSDVFSFGVLLIEIISGKRNSCGHHQHYGNFVNLLCYAWQLWREGRELELIDSKLGNCEDDEALMILRCVKVALLCVQNNATDRPTIAEAMAMLGNDAVPLPDPRRPPHFHLRVASDGDAPHFDARGSNDDDDGRSDGRRRLARLCSVNDVTVSTMQEGR